MLRVDSAVDSISPPEADADRVSRSPPCAAALDESQRAWLRYRLHDELAQYLAFALIRLDMALDGPPAERGQALVHVRHLVHQSLQVARDTLEGVDIVADNDALHLGLQRTAAEVMRLSGCCIDVDCPPIAQSVPALVAATLNRAVRELLINACKHASGARVRLHAVERGGGELTLWVHDDGPGLNLHAVGEDACGHFGLRRLPDELAALGVKLSVRNSPGHGLSARLRWCPRPQSNGVAESRSPAPKDWHA